MAKKKKKSNRKSYLAIIFIALLLPFGYYIWNKIYKKPAAMNFIELPTSFVSYGIDISHHQEKIEWDEVLSFSDSLISFVYCKATEGINHVDTQWKRNRRILLEKKVTHGAYHFFLPKKDAKKQANHFLENYQLQKDDLPPVLDAEIEGDSKQQLISQMRIWLKHVEKQTGRRPIIYTSYNMYIEFMKESFQGYKFWVANYSTKESRFQDEEIIHWQYSDNGKIPGIKTKVDLNFSKIEF